MVPEPPVAPPTKLFKEKWNVGKKAERWILRPFSSSARSDNAVFNHWAKLRDPVEDYKFAKLNKHVQILAYDDADYSSHLILNDWTQEETDYLLQMCRRFDCRFIVIYDRWEMVRPRSVEDLKDRFYFIQRKLIEIAGIKANDSFWKKHPLIKDPFNKEQEENRKTQLECLFRRDKRQIQEEDEITPKANEILETFKRHKKEGLKMVSLAQKIAQSNVSEKRGGGRGRGRGRGRTGSGASSTASSMNIKNPKYTSQINQTLDSLGVAKPDKNSKFATQYNSLKDALVVLFDLEKIQNEAMYELQVLKEQRKLLLQDKQRRLGQIFTEEEYPDQEELEPEQDQDHELEAEQENDNNEMDIDGGEADSEASSEGEDEHRQQEGDGDGDEDDEYVE